MLFINLYIAVCLIGLIHKKKKNCYTFIPNINVIFSKIIFGPFFIMLNNNDCIMCY